MHAFNPYDTHESYATITRTHKEQLNWKLGETQLLYAKGTDEWKHNYTRLGVRAANKYIGFFYQICKKDSCL